MFCIRFTISNTTRFFLLVLLCLQLPTLSKSEEYSMQSITSPTPIMKRLSLGELLSYSTIQLFAESGSETNSGTGFIVEFRNANFAKPYPMLITNKHVIEGAERLKFLLTIRTPNDLPTQETVLCTIPLSEWLVVSQPSPNVDWDVCAISLDPLLQSMRASGKLPMLFSLEIHGLEKDLLADALGPLSPLFMIGYPGGLMDITNNQPIFRTGVAATNPRLDFNGQKLFYIDMAVFPGSSGSPVIAYNDGTIHNPYTHSTVVDGQERYVLLGLVTKNRGDYVHVNVATPQGQAIPLQDRLVRIPNNLGIVIKLDRILELEDLFFKHLQQSSELATERK